MPAGNVSGLYLYKDSAWHNLGTVVQEAHNSTEVIQIIGADWEMETVKQHYHFNGELLESEVFALIRKDNGKFLASVGPRYQPYQNQQAFDFTDNLVENQEIVYETAGILNGGKQVWILVRMPHVTEITQDDIINNYVMLISNNDGLGGIWFGSTKIRIVCENTFNHAISLAYKENKNKTYEQKTAWSIRHTSKTEENLEKAREIFREVNNLNEIADNQYREMAKTQITRNQFEEYANDIVDFMYPPKKKDEEVVTTYTPGISLLDMAIEHTGNKEEERSRPADRMLEMILSNYDNEKNTLPGIAGTAWSAFNSVTEYTNHQINYRGRRGTDETRYKSENRANNLLTGKAASVNDYAYQQAITRFKN